MFQYWNVLQLEHVQHNIINGYEYCVYLFKVSDTVQLVNLAIFIRKEKLYQK